MSEGTTARLNGIDIYFERFGNGPRLLFFNGSGTSLATSRPMVEAYASKFEVLVHDQRGLGATSVPPGPYTMAEYAADAIALLDHVGWDTCRVVGISFGGMVAQEFAVTVPERVERLALLCTSPGGHAASYPLHTVGPDEGARMLTILDTRYTSEFLAAHPEHRSFVELLASRPDPTDQSPEVLRGMREQLLARADHDVLDRLGRITCPTLVQSGAYDGIAPPENGRLIASLIPGAEYREYNGGHLFTIQDRRVVPDAIEFLGSS